jgi:hypothetical protein
VHGLAFPANANSAVIVVPAVRALDNPAAWSAARAAYEWRFSSSPNVRDDATMANRLLAVGVVVPLVQAEVCWAARATSSAHEDGVEGRAHHPLVVHVGSRECDSHGNAPTIGQNVTFCAAFSAIGGIWTREVPPFGAFTMAPSSEAQSQSMPRSTW